MQHGGRESVAIITKGRQLNANTPGRGRGRPVDLVPPRRPRVANRLRGNFQREFVDFLSSSKLVPVGIIAKFYGSIITAILLK